MMRPGDHGAADPPRTRLVLLGPDHLPVLERMVRAYWAEDGLSCDDRRQPTALAILVAGDPLACGWLIEAAGVAVGYAVVTFSVSIEPGGRDGFIDEVDVRPGQRDRGLGRQVLGLVEDQARGLGLERLFLEVGHGNRANGLYQRAGFVDHDRHLMSKRLCPTIGRPGPSGTRGRADASRARASALTHRRRMCPHFTRPPP